MAHQEDSGSSPSLPEGWEKTGYQPGLFLDAIQDEGTRTRLAVHRSTNGFYGKLDLGVSFDNAFATSLYLAIDNKRLLDRISETGDFSRTFGEDEWQLALEDMRAGERPDFEPSNARKKIAGLVLRQEMPLGRRRIINVSWRRIFAADEGRD